MNTLKRTYAHSPLICMSGIAGADLKGGIVRILIDHLVQKLNLGRSLLLLCAAVFASIAMPVAFGFAESTITINVNSAFTAGLASSTPTQAGSPTQVKPHDMPSFEVSSIKPGRPGEDHVTMFYTADGFTATDVPLEMLIKEAYRVEGQQILGAPNWIFSKNYDIQAKVDVSAVDGLRKLSIDERKIMLQPVLADRFRLRVHWQTKELPVYSLVIAKKGPKLREAKPGDKYPNGIIGPNGPMGAGLLWIQGGQLIAQGSTLEGLVRVLSRQLGTDVLDKTGLTGKYDFRMQLPPREGSVFTPMQPPGDQQTSDDALPPELSGPSIFTIVQEQLGLKLDSTKGLRECLVIDNVEQPSEN
jgi:uncharacterized protein (TIGR03435 family)